ncbi:DNA repair protein RadA [Amorphus sp. MBR-141]
MAKRQPRFVCQECGTVTNRWAGKCESCGAWNSISEETATDPILAGTGKVSSVRGRPVKLESLAGTSDEPPRLQTGIAELDRVTGGGFVPGSVLLVGGDPGIGKSTLLLQAAARLAMDGGHVVYISGEEAIPQVRMRAERLGASGAPVALASETCVEDILATLQAGPRPGLVIIDSIQTLWTSIAESAPGTVSQVRASAQALIRYAKTSGATVVLVGHVTKDGQIAGPRVVEHMVDAVITFEGDGSHSFRLLRATKNRFGPTDEIGVFEMTGSGLREVDNPSQLFLGERDTASPGAAVFAGMEGTRPLLVEIQALVAPSTLGTPRRAVVGWDSSRLAMVIAVLEARCGVRLGSNDVYLAVAGGLRITEPAADLAVAAALISSLGGLALPSDCVYFGEVSLSGRVRSVAHAAGRLKEAEKLGFGQAVVPESVATDSPKGLRTVAIGSLNDLIGRLFEDGEPDGLRGGGDDASDRKQSASS